MELKLRATMYLTEGSRYLSSGTPFHYEVEGLPRKMEGFLWNRGNTQHPDWRIRLANDHVSNGWMGQYDSEQLALDALSDMVAQQLPGTL